MRNAGSQRTYRRPFSPNPSMLRGPTLSGPERPPANASISLPASWVIPTEVLRRVMKRRGQSSRLRQSNGRLCPSPRTRAHLRACMRARVTPCVELGQPGESGAAGDGHEPAAELLLTPKQMDRQRRRSRRHRRGCRTCSHILCGAFIASARRGARIPCRFAASRTLSRCFNARATKQRVL